MIMFENSLREIFLEFWDNVERNYLKRNDLERMISTNTSYLLVGPRRAGKSAFLFLYAEHSGKDPRDFVFVNFEDPRLIGFRGENLMEIIDTYKTIYPNRKPIFLVG